MLDFNAWVLKRTARRTEAKARTGAQQATVLAQQALTQRSQRSALNALAALSKAVRDAKSATSAAHRLVVHEQQHAQGDIPDALAAGAWLAVQTTTTLADQVERERAGLLADPTGQAVLAYLGSVSEVTQGIEWSLAQTAKVVEATRAARARRDTQQ